jgi:hypothetical protein
MVIAYMKGLCTTRCYPFTNAYYKKYRFSRSPQVYGCVDVSRTKACVESKMLAICGLNGENTLSSSCLLRTPIIANTLP